MSVKEWIADGLRGRPDVDLAGYAAERGLEQCGNAAQLGYIPAFPLTSELQFNVLRGRLPGGEEGVLYHEVKLEDEESSGTWYGQKVSLSQARAKDLVAVTGITAEPVRYFKVPHTTAAVRVPQAQGAVVGLDVGRGSERVLHAAPDGEGFRSGFTLDLSFLSRRKKKDDGPLQQGPQPWVGRELHDLELGDWRVAHRGRADREVVAQVLAGPIRELLLTSPPLGFRIRFEYGVLFVTQQHFLKAPEELDLFAQRVSWLAGAIRQVCTETADPQPFDSELPAPDWAEKIENAEPHETFVGLDNQDLRGFHAIARERGLASEDPYAFHRAFPDLPVPGEAYGVMRGTLPGTTVTGRVVAGVERSLAGPPPYWDRVLDEMPHGPAGSDTVIVPVRPGAPDAHPDTGAAWGDGGYAVRRGLLVAWRPRATPNADGAALDALAAEAVALAREQGLLDA